MEISWNEWKNLNSLRGFDDSYPQKLRIAFFFLSVGNEASSYKHFLLKDFVNRGVDVLPYLGINLENDSMDSLLDLYGKFDRDGAGFVKVEDFVVGILEFVCTMRQNTKLLQEIAKDLLLIESRYLELATLLEKVGTESNANQPMTNVASFRKNLKPFSSYISNEIRAIPQLQNLSALNISLLVELLQNSLSRATEETMIYFHIGRSELKMLIENQTTSSAGESDASPLIWNVPKLESECYPWINSFTNSLFLNASEPTNEKLLRVSSSNTNAHEWRNLTSLRDANKETPSTGVIHDTAQLFLLQNTYLTIQNFFEFLTTYQSQSSVANDTDSSNALKEQLKFLTASTQGNNLVVKSSFDQSGIRAAHKDALVEKHRNSNSSNEALCSILTEELLFAQEKLFRVQSRLELLESIQSHIMCDYLYQQHVSCASATNDAKCILSLNNNSISSGEDSNHSKNKFSSSCFDGLMVEDIKTSQKFEEILQELQHVECQIADRSHHDYAFGLLLDDPLIIISESKKQCLSNDENGVDLLFQDVKQKFKELQSIHLGNLEGLKFQNVQQLESAQQFHKQSLLQHKHEQIESEHSELLKLTLEVQILREQNILLLKQQQENSSLMEKNRELHQLVLSLQDASVAGKLSADVSAKGANQLATSTKHGDLRSSSDNKDEQYHQLKEQYQKILNQSQHLQQQYDSLCKENSRAKSTIQQTESQIKSILHDSLVLHQQIHSLQEENSNQSNKILQLTQQCHDAAHFKQLWHDQEKQILELKRELMKKDVRIQELEENMTLVDKYHSDLLQAERTIETLETKISECAVELEKGLIVNNQLSKLRDVVQRKSNENNNLMMKIYQLEHSNQDIPYYTSRIQEMVEEISDMKIKIEKIPGLLAEIARLRGSSRAALRSLSEQDKLLVNYKNRIKSLEKENFLLKQDNQSLQDLESKLKDSNNEIKRLMNILNEIQAMKMNAKNVEEEKKVMEGQYKKMRKFMRQSVLTSPINTSNVGGVTNTVVSESQPES